MGTRNLTCVIVEGQYRIAQYGQWDGYPDGQGATALNFIQSVVTGKAEKDFIARCQALTWLSAGDMTRLWEAAGADKSGAATMDVAEEFKKRNPGLSRDEGANILDLVYEGKVTAIQDDHGFARDSLFCEWAYVLDMDQRQLEVYKGFNKSAEEPPGRFAAEYEEGKEYYPITHVKTYSFDELPSEEGFVQEINDLTADPDDE